MKKIIRILIVLLVPASLWAQTDSNETQAKQEVTKSVRSESKSFSATNSTPGGTSNLQNPYTTVSLSSELKDLSGKASINLVAGFHSLEISAQQKIASDAKEATPFNLDGLTPGTTVGFSYQYMFWKKASKKSFAYFDALRSEYVKANKMTQQSDIDALTFGQIRNDASVKNYLNNFHLTVPVFLRASYSFTKTAYEYTTDSVTLASKKDNKITHNAQVSLGIKLKDRGIVSHFLSIGFNFSTKYSSGDKMTFMTPFGSSGNFYSRDAIFGAPTLKTEEKINLEYGAAFRLTSGFQIQLDPTATVALASQKISIQLPIYFKIGTNDDKNAFKGFFGGFRLGYMSSLTKATSFHDGFGAEIVLAAPFDLFSKLGK